MSWSSGHASSEPRITAGRSRGPKSWDLTKKSEAEHLGRSPRARYPGNCRCMRVHEHSGSHYSEAESVRVERTRGVMEVLWGGRQRRGA